MSSVTFGLFFFTKSTQNSFKNLSRFVKANSVQTVTSRSNSGAIKSKSSLLEKINSDVTSSDLISFLTTKRTKFCLKDNRNRYCTTCEEDKDDKDDKDILKYNYHEEIEKAVNSQITTEFVAALSYLSMACFFGRTSIGLLGTQKFYMTMYREEINHALKLIKYQEMRGGHVEITQVKVTNCGEECTIKKSLEIALQMEKSVADMFSQILALARKHQDIRTEDFLITEFINEQIQSIRNLGNLVTMANKMAEGGLSQYMLDKELATSIGHTITTKAEQ